MIACDSRIMTPGLNSNMFTMKQYYYNYVSIPTAIYVNKQYLWPNIPGPEYSIALSTLLVCYSLLNS